MIESPWSGIAASYKDPHEFQQALGLTFMAWFVFAFFLAVASSRTLLGYFIAVSLADLTLLVLGIGHFYESVGINKAGGWIGIVCAFASYYCAAAALFKEVGLLALPNPELIYNRTS